MVRFRNVLNFKECALMRRMVLDAALFFNDTAPNRTARRGARALNDELKPRYRMQNERQLSLYFSRPPAVMEELYRRIGRLTGVHPSNIEAIYHLYAPGALPANLHLDNFNKFLFPHRYASMSMFFDDLEDGGTVFPLLASSAASPAAGSAAPLPPSVAAEVEEVEQWHKLINDTRMEQRTDGYAFRRVDEDEAHPFRRRALAAAIAMCEAGRAAQGPVVPERGSAYMWKNYRDNGEDDVLTIHAGCGSRRAFKILGTFFMRDWPGPFQEHRSFWDPLEPRGEDIDEMQRLLEAQTLQSFRLRHLKELYAHEREVMRELQGDRAEDWLLRQQIVHLQSLMEAQMDESLTQRIGEISDTYGTTDIPWMKVLPTERVF